MKVNPQDIGYLDPGVIHIRRFAGLVEPGPDGLTSLTTKRWVMIKSA